ncbi:unnamed protein product, partial [Prorocentrum cordatum]
MSRPRRGAPAFVLCLWGEAWPPRRSQSVDIGELEPRPSAGKRRALAGAIEVAQKRFASPAREGRAPRGAGPSSGRDAIGELSRLLKGEGAPAAHVGGCAQPAVGHADGLAVCARNRAACVAGLASEIAKLEKNGIVMPFVRADLRHWAPLGIEPARSGGRAEGEGALSWARWHLAFDACSSAGK